MESLLHKWQVNLYPLRVLYATTLRLRYRVVWEREARQFNRNLGVTVFREPELAEAYPYMVPGLIYIEDSAINEKNSHVFVNYDNGRAVSALVQLPTDEKDCCQSVKSAISLLFNHNL